MAIIQKKLQMAYSASDMFRLVDDVDQYQDFLPWCKHSKVLSRTPHEVRAMLVLAAGGFQKSFTTANRIQKNKIIDISLIDGPFRRLEGFWLFHPDSKKSCTVQFELEFEFSTRLLAMAFSPVFHQVAHTLVEAFAKRAGQIYGKR